VEALRAAFITTRRPAHTPPHALYSCGRRCSEYGTLTTSLPMQNACAYWSATVCRGCRAGKSARPRHNPSERGAIESPSVPNRRMGLTVYVCMWEGGAEKKESVAGTPISHRSACVAGSAPSTVGSFSQSCTAAGAPKLPVRKAVGSMSALCRQYRGQQRNYHASAQRAGLELRGTSPDCGKAPDSRICW